MRARFYIKIKRLPRFFVDGFSSFPFFFRELNYQNIRRDLAPYRLTKEKMMRVKTRGENGRCAFHKFQSRQMKRERIQKEGQTIREGTFEPEKKKEIWWCYITTIHLMMILHTCEKKKQLSLYLKSISVNVQIRYDLNLLTGERFTRAKQKRKAASRRQMRI